MNRAFPACCVLVLTLLTACAEDPKPVAAPRGAQETQRRAPHRTASLSAAQIGRVMNAKASALSGCYEISETKTHSAGGSMTIEFGVGTNGRVSGEHLGESTVSDRVLSDCVLGIVQKAHFPKATAPTEVSWPVRFRAGSGGT